MTSDLFTFLLLTSFLENKQTAEAKEEREKWLHGLGTFWEEENSKNRRRKSASYSPHTSHYKVRFGSIVKLFVAVVLRPVSFKSTNGSNEKKAIENMSFISDFWLPVALEAKGAKIFSRHLGPKLVCFQMSIKIFVILTNFGPYFVIF